ncbi:MAG: Fe(3+)-siderophore ABC transporter permease [Pantoea sp.]|uniref:Fe(3+)-siderophore ABC transporter permease n=1 Tax=Pantoea septica TaxID=472695 RepID=UPI001C11DBD5|nr:Fe(3+)-siderophore ABC transporter permease [Pantoea septica]MBU5377655.1 Fe(3+)-siderophore ABC transporter permease [Pantoea septica]MDU5838194.1 Fe(3+)-siderophore ABC transporter permease [Pantoea sp.]MDU6440595.1 Fe(3+)-siderophore ABC transporter permease [Pantoea sp.]
MRQLTAIAASGMLLLLLLALSLMLGAKSIAIHDVSLALTTNCGSADCVIVREARLPRTLAGLLAGCALGLAGALMQSLTRNPLADPGILGVNAGAGFAVVLGIALFGADSPADWLGFAFVGALLASLLVALTGALGGGRVNPVRLTLAGVALGAVLEGLTSGLSLLNPDIYDHLRFWHSGSLDIRSFAMLRATWPAVAVGALIALLLARALNTLSMGGDLATALGTRVARTQLLGLLAIALLSGGATAAVGPVAFIGLMTPHLARWLWGNDHRWMLPGTLLTTPCLLLAADILGRLMVPGELRVSVVTALLGAPMLIVLVRRKLVRGQV